jgi:hypothetical protein
VAEVAVALVHLDLVFTSFTRLLEVGVLVEASIARFTSHSVKTSSKLFSSFQTCSCTLDIALNSLEIVLRGEATCCVSSSHDGGNDRLHCWIPLRGRVSKKKARKTVQEMAPITRSK